MVVSPQGVDIADKLTLWAASPAVSANKGARHCGQANPVHSKPSGFGQRGRKASRARVAVVQKGVNGTAAQQSKQQSNSKPAAVMAKRHETMGELLFFVQQGE
jgi:hypothetical protein